MSAHVSIKLERSIRPRHDADGMPHRDTHLKRRMNKKKKTASIPEKPKMEWSVKIAFNPMAGASESASLPSYAFHKQKIT